MDQDTVTAAGVVVDIDRGLLTVRQGCYGGVTVSIDVAVSTVGTVADAQDNGWINQPIVSAVFDGARQVAPSLHDAVVWAEGLGWRAVGGAGWRDGMFGFSLRVVRTL